MSLCLFLEAPSACRLRQGCYHFPGAPPAPHSQCKMQPVLAWKLATSLSSPLAKGQICSTLLETSLPAKQFRDCATGVTSGEQNRKKRKRGKRKGGRGKKKKNWECGREWFGLGCALAYRAHSCDSVVMCGRRHSPVACRLHAVVCPPQGGAPELYRSSLGKFRPLGGWCWRWLDRLSEAEAFLTGHL